MTRSSIDYRPATVPRIRAWVQPAPAALALLTVLALALRFWSFSSIPSDPFYDAAVRSMSLSWRNFFFGAFDPSAALSIDKPPIDLWLQVASAKAFGFSTISVRLPEAIAGTLAVPLLYDLVRRGFGRVAGLSAAAALAVLPVAVMTSRSDTMDTLCGTVLIGAAWMIVAVRPPRGVLLAAALAGLAFEIKLFQAAVAFPALAVLALCTVRTDRKRMLGRAAAVFVAVAAAWPVIASLVPGPHPWPIGSSNGQLWNVILVYNGLYRLNTVPGVSTLAGPSPWRLFTPGFMAIIGYHLLLTIGLAIPVLWDRRRSYHPLGVAIVVWIACGVVFFSLQGHVRLRYFEAFTPAVAAGLGISIATLTRARPGLTALVLVAALAWPLTTSVDIARTGRFDSQTLGALPASYVHALEPYTRSGKLAVSSAVLAGPLIEHDATPLTILTSWNDRPFTTVAELKAEIARGDVRYALLDPAKSTPAVQWAIEHGQDITAAIGPQGGLKLVRFTVVPLSQDTAVP